MYNVSGLCIWFYESTCNMKAKMFHSKFRRQFSPLIHNWKGKSQFHAGFDHFSKHFLSWLVKWMNNIPSRYPIYSYTVTNEKWSPFKRRCSLVKKKKLKLLKMKFVQADPVSHKEDNPSNRIFLKLYFQMKIESGQVGVIMPPGATRIRGHS